MILYDNLLRWVCGVSHPGSPQVILTHLLRLRCKLGEETENPTYILADQRVGLPDGGGGVAGVIPPDGYVD